MVMCCQKWGAKLAIVLSLYGLTISRTYAQDVDTRAAGIARQSACLGCHAVNKKIVGPSYQDVAKKYANDPGAFAFLKNKIKYGGAGSWGVVPMPANTKLSDADLSLLVVWILRGAPAGS